MTCPRNTEQEILISAFLLLNRFQFLQVFPIVLEDVVSAL